MAIFEQIGIDIGFVLLGTIGVSVLLLILVIILFAKQSKTNKKYRKFMMGNDAKSLEETFANRFKELDEMKKELEVTSNSISEITETLVSVYQKLGIVKYDAFKEMGGKLSFALALLNQQNDGFVINSMHSSREGCYTYVKEIIKGESFVLLAEEEKEALNLAIKSNNFME